MKNFVARVKNENHVKKMTDFRRFCVEESCHSEKKMARASTLNEKRSHIPTKVSTTKQKSSRVL